MVAVVQRHMPHRRSGHTTTFTIGPERFCLTANQGEDGSLGEVFLHWGKHGTSGAGLVNSYAIALSVGLQHHVPLPDLIRLGLDQWFVPHGHTDDPEIPRVRSAVDYIARRLAIDCGFGKAAEPRPGHARQAPAAAVRKPLDRRRCHRSIHPVP